MSIKPYDVIVIGGGPAGMMSAGMAASRGLSVLLLEKNPMLGKKLSITGGGRCNITNAEFDTRALLAHYGKAESFLYAPFAQFGVQDTFDFFMSRGLPLMVEDRKRAFPETQKAIDVTRLMEKYVRGNGCVVRTSTPIDGFEVIDGVVTGVRTSAGVFRASTYILASGGASHQETGSTGDGFTWLRDIGHTVHVSNPNLVPLVARDSWVKKLSGTTLHGVRITFTSATAKIAKQGDILMTHFGISGPLVLNSAYEVKEMLEEGNVEVSIDLFPSADVGTLRARVQRLAEEHGNKTLINGLREWFPRGVVEAILRKVPEQLQAQKMHSMERALRHAVVESMKALTLTITGTKGLDWAVVSDGGVDLTEIDTRTMRSKIHANVYVVGDVLNVNRPSGGYSLQLCWTTGYVAGKHVCA